MKTIIVRFLTKFRARIVFFILGLGSLVWFLIRVIPKPSRAAYPCMKAAVPLASSFVTYLLGITSFTFLFRKARERLIQSKYLLATVFAALGLTAGIVAIVSNNNATWAITLQPLQAGNEPMGVAKGIFPGRVVWVHDTDATNEDCTNETGDYWYMDSNTDQVVVSSMFSSGIQQLTGTDSDAAAWDSIFHYYNRTHGNGNIGYQSGDDIAIKINLNGDANTYTSTPPKNINTAPQLCYVLLDQLINVAGVAQANISIGDPSHHCNDVTWDKCHTAFPDVIYWGTGGGRTYPDQSTSNVLFGSLDGGENDFADPLPQAYLNAEYLINVPVFKKHHRAGISLGTKNHFGSVAPYTGGAWHLHPSLPIPDADADQVSDDLPTLQYGVYRCFVDIMGHEDLGGKTIIYIVDGLWGSTNWGHPPVKWRMTPFNNDWPNSLFISQDPVAVESVCYDFLYQEFDEDHPTEGMDVLGDDKGPFSRFPAADDFLHQAADPANWPEDIEYDPEDDGLVLTSLGTHEHWNNATDKLYTRNLGTGNGIELVSDYTPVAYEHIDYIPEGFEIRQNIPNPFNESTTIQFKLAVPSIIQLKIYNTQGELVKLVKYNQRMSGIVNYQWNGDNNQGVRLPEGTYICTFEIYNSRGSFTMSNKMVMAK